MSDYHIRSMESKKRNVRCVFHVPIPAAGTNSAGISWRAALVEELLEQSEAIVSALPNIDPAELAEMGVGAVLEVIETVTFSKTNLTPAQRRAEVEAAYTARTAAVTAEKVITLEWMGYEANAV